MTRPDKHAARFGVRYQPPIDWRRLTKAMPDILVVMRRVTEAFRQAADNMRRAREFEDTARQVEAVFSRPSDYWTFVPDVANTAAPTVAELKAGTPIRLETESITITGPYRVQLSSGRSILDRIDDTLLTYDSQHADGTEPWPYRGF